MTTHPETIPYSEWVELKKFIHQLLTTGYDGDERYRVEIMRVMREIEKTQVHLELVRKEENEIPTDYQDGYVVGYSQGRIQGRKDIINPTVPEEPLVNDKLINIIVESYRDDEVSKRGYHDIKRFSKADD